MFGLRILRTLRISDPLLIAHKKSIKLNDKCLKKGLMFSVAFSPTVDKAMLIDDPIPNAYSSIDIVTQIA